MTIPDLQNIHNRLVCRGMQCHVDEFTIIALKEEDAPELAALEAEAFSTSFDAPAYCRMLRGAHPAFLIRGTILKNGGAYRLSTLATTYTGNIVEELNGSDFATPILGLRDSSGVLTAYIRLGLSEAAGEMEIYNISVREKFRRLGLGTLLLETTLDRAAGLGLERALLEVRVSNDPALALYASAGFAASGRRKGYYSDTGEDALVLECNLRDRQLLRLLLERR